MYRFKVFRTVLAGGLALLSPLWCCCTSAWGDAAEYLLARSTPALTGQSGCSGCSSGDKDCPDEDRSSRASDICHCGHHQKLDVAVTGPCAPRVVTPQVSSVVGQWSSCAAFTPPLGLWAIHADIRGAPPRGGPQSLFALDCLLLI